MTMKQMLASCLLSALMLTAGTASAATLKVMTHNIRDGFSPYDSNTQDYRTVAQNRADFVAFMKKRSPDILCLQELCSGKGERFNTEKFSRIAREYGHPYTVLLHSPLGIGVSSKYPIKLVYRGAPKGFTYRGMMHVQVCGLNIINTHLNPTGPFPRLREAEVLKNYIRSNSLQRVLLMGDLNSRSPFDGDLYPERRLWTVDYREAPLNALKDTADYSVMGSLLSYPLIDTLRLFVPNARDRMTWPTYCYADRHKNEFPDKIGERIDYILATADLAPALRNGFIWNHACEPADKHKEENAIRAASDHAPNELWLEIPDGDLK